MMKHQEGNFGSTSNKPDVFQIRTESIAGFLGEEDHPLFIAVLRKDANFTENFRQLSEVAKEFEKDGLIVCYTLEDLLPYFTIRFGIGGTPTFLMIIGGIVLGTMLGKNSSSSLAQFIKEHLREYNTGGKPGKEKQARSARRKEVEK